MNGTGISPNEKATPWRRPEIESAPDATGADGWQAFYLMAIGSPCGRVATGLLFKNDTNIVFRFASVRSVDCQDLHEPIKHGWSHATHGPFEF